MAETGVLTQTESGYSSLSQFLPLPPNASFFFLVLGFTVAMRSLLASELATPAQNSISRESI